MPNEITDIAKFIELEDFLLEKHSPFSSHNLLHRLRVLVFAVILANKCKVNPQNLIYAAYYHDFMRTSDQEGPTHGESAMNWIKKNFKFLYPNLRQKDIDEIGILCRDHAVSDEKAINMSLDLKILKDADALDRTRFGRLAFTAQLDPRFLRLEESRNLHANELNKKLYTLTTDTKATNPEQQLSAIILALKELELPIIFSSIPKWIYTDRSLPDYAKHSKLARVYIEYVNLIEKRTSMRTLLAQFGFDKRKVIKQNIKLKSVSQRISAIRNQAGKLAKENSDILSHLRMLSFDNPAAVEFREMQRFVYMTLLEEDKLHSVRLDPNLLREFLRKDDSISTNMAFASALLDHKTFEYDEDYIRNLFSQVTLPYLGSQENRIAYYKTIIKADNRGFISDGLKEIILNSLTDLVDNKLWQIKGRILKAVINPFINFYRDDEDAFRYEVELLGNVFLRLCPSDVIVADKQILPILLNREFGNLSLIKKYIPFLPDEDLKKKWMKLIRLEQNNRKKKNSYFHSVREYTKLHSKENLELISRIFNVALPAKENLKDYELCLNLPFENFMKIVYNSKEFFVAWNKTNEKDVQYIAHTFEKLLRQIKILGDGPQMNSFKETTTLIRRPNRVYNHATYGYLSSEIEGGENFMEYLNDLNKFFIRSYGNTKIVLKDKMKERSVYSLFDSMFPYREYMLDYNDARAVKQLLDKNFMKINMKHGFLSVTATYIEAKILENVNSTDIEKVLLPKDKYNDQLIRSLHRIMPQVKFERY